MGPSSGTGSLYQTLVKAAGKKFDEMTVTFQPSNPNRPIIIITEVAHPINGITTHLKFLKINQSVKIIKMNTPTPNTAISFFVFVV